MAYFKKLHTLLQDTSFTTAIFLFVLGAFITNVLFYSQNTQPSILAQIASSQPAVLGRQYPLPQPDVSSGDGGNIVVENVSAIISEGTFDQDVYMRVDRTARGNPISEQGLWQVSDMWDVRMKYMSNDNEVPTADTKRNFILAFPYTQDHLKTDQGIRFDENNLKLLRGETAAGPWEVISSTVVDTSQKTVSIVTNQDGFFTIGGGFYAPPADSASANSQGRVALKENEVIVTITPSPETTPTIGVKSQKEETPEPTDAPDTVPIGGASAVGPDNFFSAVFGFIQSLFNQ